MMTQNLQNVCDLSLPKVNQIIMKGKFNYQYMYLFIWGHIPNIICDPYDFILYLCLELALMVMV